MPAAPLVGYVRDPDLGGYSFRRADGSELYAHGDDAAALAAGLPDLRLAQAETSMSMPQDASYGAPAETPAPVAPAVPDAPLMTPAAPMTPAPPTEPLASEPPPVSAGSVSPSPPAAPVDPGGSTLARVEDLPPQLPPDLPPPDDAPRVISWGATPGGYEATSRSTKITGGMDPEVAREAWDAQADARINEQLVVQQQAAEKAQAEAAAAARARDDAFAKAAEATQARLRQRYIKTAYETRRKAAMRERDAVRTRQVDPARLWGGQGTVGHVISMIGVALGAYSSGLRGGPNQVAELVDRAVDRDLAIQRDQLERNGLAADNKLAELMREYGMELDEATAMLAGLQRDYITANAEAAAYASKSAATIKAWELWKAQQDRETVGAWTAWLEKAQGAVERTTAERYRPAVAAGSRRETDQEFMRRKSREYGTESAYYEAIAKKRKAEVEAYRSQGYATGDDEVRRVHLRDGTVLLAKSVEDAKVLKERAAAYGRALAQLEEIDRLRAEWKKMSVAESAAELAADKIGKSAYMARVRYARAQLVREEASMGGQQAPTAVETEEAAKVTPDPTKPTSSEGLLRGWRSAIMAKFRESATPYTVEGAVPDAPTYVGEVPTK